MLNTVASILFLSTYHGPKEGVGRRVFFVGKCIGTVGRVIGFVFVVVVGIAATVDKRSLLLSFLTLYVVVAVAIATEVLSSVLMFLGHWIAAKRAGLFDRQA